MRHRWLWLSGLALIVGVMTPGWSGAGQVGTTLFIEDDGTVSYRLDSGTQKIQFCNTAKTNCLRWRIDDSDGPVAEAICSGSTCDQMIAIPDGKTLSIAVSGGATGILVDEDEIEVFDLTCRTTDHATPATNHLKTYCKTGSPDALYTKDEAGTVTRLNAAITKSIVVLDPTATETNLVQFIWPTAVTITRVDCSTNTGSITVNLDERVLTTPNTSGTNTLSAGLVCDTGNQSSCASGCDVNTISDSSIAAGVPYNLQLSSPSGTPGVVRVHITGVQQ